MFYSYFETYTSIVSQIWTLALRTEHISHVHENWVLGGIFSYKRNYLHCNNKIGRLYSFEYTDTAEALFKPNHEGHRWITNVIRDHCCALGHSFTVIRGNCCATMRYNWASGTIVSQQWALMTHCWATMYLKFAYPSTKNTTDRQTRTGPQAKLFSRAVVLKCGHRKNTCENHWSREWRAPNNHTIRVYELSNSFNSDFMVTRRKLWWGGHVAHMRKQQLHLNLLVKWPGNVTTIQCNNI
jgi:hypothetical protein